MHMTESNAATMVSIAKCIICTILSGAIFLKRKGSESWVLDENAYLKIQILLKVPEFRGSMFHFIYNIL